MAEQAIAEFQGMVSLLECLAQACYGAGSATESRGSSSRAGSNSGRPSIGSSARSFGGAHATLAEARTAKVRTAVVADATDKVSSNSDAADRARRFGTQRRPQSVESIPNRAQSRACIAHGLALLLRFSPEKRRPL